MNKEENGQCREDRGGGGEVRHGGIDLLLSLYRRASQVLSAHNYPLSSSHLFFPSYKVGLFPDLSELGETARQ